MIKPLEHKGYLGSVEVSVEDGCLFGKLLYIQDLILYQGETVLELQKAFEKAVDDYLETCEELGWEPKKPCKGTFQVRLGPELHLAAAEAATLEGVSLNDYVKTAVKERVKKGDGPQVHIHLGGTATKKTFRTTIPVPSPGVAFDENHFTLADHRTRQKENTQH